MLRRVPAPVQRLFAAAVGSAHSSSWSASRASSSVSVGFAESAASPPPPPPSPFPGAPRGTGRAASFTISGTDLTMTDADEGTMQFVPA